MNFLDQLKSAIKKNNSLLCIGLDPDLEKFPHHLKDSEDPIFEFNKKIIDETHDLVCCYKPNIAYYSARGVAGLVALEKTIEYIHSTYSDIPVILDAKRGDVGHTAQKYAQEAFDLLKADAVTINPYLGYDSLEPFLKRRDKGIIILCRTSNPGAENFQDLKIGGQPLYMRIAKKVIVWNRRYKNCLLVVGATWPTELKKIRKAVPKMFFLCPGIGTQNGQLQKTLRNGLTKDKSGLIIHVGRSIMYASSGTDFGKDARKEAEKIVEEINKFRK